MASTTPSEATIVRRLAAAKRLEKQIPRLNLTSIIIRVTQFLILGGFSLAYAMSQPDVYLDIFVWPQNRAPPFEMVVFRNTTYGWEARVEYLLIRHNWDRNDIFPVMKVEWNKTTPPPGLSEKYVCAPDPRWGCNGTQWAATRIGWLDSWPFDDSIPKWVAATVHIDRYIFWLLLAGGYLGSGHNIIVILHALEPSGLGFYKYSAIMDFIISTVFLLLGIFPIAIQRHLQIMKEEEPYGFRTNSYYGLYTSELKENQQYVFCMGWILWALYTITFLLNTILVRNLERYKRLPKAPSSVDRAEGERTVIGSSNGYQVSRQVEAPEIASTGSYGRHSGRS